MAVFVLAALTWLPQNFRAHGKGPGLEIVCPIALIATWTYVANNVGGRSSLACCDVCASASEMTRCCCFSVPRPPALRPRLTPSGFWQMMNNMRKQIQEKDVVLSQLRADLIGERDKRLAAEMKLDEMLDRSSGRMSFLMVSSLLFAFLTTDVFALLRSIFGLNDYSFSVAWPKKGYWFVAERQH